MWSYTTTTFPGEAGAERHKAAGRAHPAVLQELVAARQAQAPAEVRQGRAIAAVRQEEAPAAVRQEWVLPRVEWRCKPPPGRPFPNPHTACVR